MFSVEWELEMIGRLFLALILGAIIGMERESVNKSAGFRTHVLVVVGSCLMMIISISMPFIQFPGQAQAGHMTANGDPGRIAAQVVSGIGFLGAGAIMRSGITIRGLTTAASLWAMAGIGLAIGAGLYVSGIAGTFLIYISLAYFAKLENSTRLRKQLVSVVLLINDSTGCMCTIFSVFDSMNISVKNTKIMNDDNEHYGQDIVKLELLAKISTNTNLQLLEEKLVALPEVQQVEIA